MTKREAQRQTHQENTLLTLGFSIAEAAALRRISMQLHRWYELECGDGNGCIERDENTGRTFWHNATSGRLTRIPDRETGAIKRLDTIMASHEPLSYYLQTDPRGAVLYLIRPGDVPTGAAVDSYYNRGICIY